MATPTVYLNVRLGAVQRQVEKLLDIIRLCAGSRITYLIRWPAWGVKFMRKRREYQQLSIGISRRAVLRAGLLLPIAGVVPSLFTRVASAQAATPFDFYISPTGSDSNPGTEASPWAITSLVYGSANYSKLSGKKIGFLDGTYDVSGFKPGDYEQSTIILNGGTSTNPTVLQAVNQGMAVIYVNPTAATTTFKGTSIMGDWYGSPSPGYITIDGLVFNGFGYKAVQLGPYSGYPGTLYAGYRVQNCEFKNGNASTAPSGGNCACLELGNAIGAYIGNNYFHDNVPQTAGPPPNSDHYSAVIQWECYQSTIELNTLVNTGGIFGKEGRSEGLTLRYNYVDCSGWTNVSVLQDFAGSQAATSAGYNAASTIHHNIFIGITAADLEDVLGELGWSVPLSVYNNTFLGDPTNGFGGLGFRAMANSGNNRFLTFYNNIFYDRGNHSSAYGMVTLNASAAALIDYNMYSTGAFYVVPDGTYTSAGGTYISSLSAWQAKMAGSTGAEAHSFVSNSPNFSGTGSLAQKYHLQATSAAYQSGRSDGTPAGSVCDMGAWGNGAPLIIGCNFEVVAPNPPVLSIG